MKQLQIKDNQNTLKEDFYEISQLSEELADKTLGQLEKEGVFVFPPFIVDSEDVSKEQFILQTINHHYQSSNVMGFLGLRDQRLTIASRFSTSVQDYFFQYLLEKVLEIPNIVDLNIESHPESQIVDLLMYIFPYYLKKAMRKGLYKKYVYKKYNDINFKGTLDIARHIQQNTPFSGKISYNRREFSFDNSLTELIRHTIEYLNTNKSGKILLQNVREESSKILQITKNYQRCDRRKIIIKNQQNTLVHAYYQEYRDLQRLCLMILQHEKHQINNGFQRIHGLIFDGAWLWEEYINTLISDLFYHPMNKSKKGKHWLFTNENGRPQGLIYPDFIGRDPTRRMIADAKYKPSDNIGNKDYLQVLAYMFRFNAEIGFYLYPECESANSHVMRLNQGTSFESNERVREETSLVKCGLQIPNKVSSYEEFKCKIKKNEEFFLEIIKAKL